MSNIAILGAGSWGTALATHLARKGLRVRLWARSAEQVEEMRASRKNSRYLPEIELPDQILPVGDLSEALSGAATVISAVPSHAFRVVLANALPLMNPEAVFINAAKGIDEDTLQRISEIYEEVAGSPENYVVLSGPSHAEEVCLAMPTAVVVASYDVRQAAQAQETLMSDTFRVYTNPDVVGVELGGSLKNIIALGAGIADGQGFGDNTKAALITRGLAEITRLGMAMGADPLTFAGLAGLGDLIVTCTSVHSRNWKAGYEIGRGNTPQEALAKVRMVVEGFRTTRAAKKMSRRFDVEMPITDQIYQVLYENKNPRDAVNALMDRGKKDELADVPLNFSRLAD